MDNILPKIGTHNSATGEKGHGIISWLVTPFSKCQNRSIASQIKMGCRYIDLRIAIKDGEWRAAHGLWTSERTINDILEDIDRTARILNQKIYVSFTVERGEVFLCNILKGWIELKYKREGIEYGVIPTYIAHKKPKWTIYHVYEDIPCKQGFLPLDGHSWHTYLPIPWLWKKIYHNHPHFDNDCYNLVDFL